MTAFLEKRLLSVKEYHKMGEVGILAPDDRLELINGEIIKMSPLNSKHTSHVKRITALFYRLLDGQVTISIQDPVELNDYSEPEPDIAVLKFREDFYAEKHPLPVDVILLVEVADSTVVTDKKVKMPLYAKSGIPELWIVNLQENVIEVYKDNEGGVFKTQKSFKKGDTLPLSNFDISIKVDQILR